ncbi:TonB-dependent receptor [Chryseobacterium sp. A301]
MVKSFFIVILVSFSPLLVLAQKKDTLSVLEEITLDAYQKPISQMTSTKSFALSSERFLGQNPPDRLLESVNLLPGASLEQRSPGSYRLALRGSSLRSPFGVRNVKMYLDEFILTEASGSSSLNSIDPTFIKSMALYKGPEAGDFGASTGGTAVLHTQTKNSVGLSIGSYGAFSQNLSFSKIFGKHSLTLLQGYSRADNYREQSRFSRASVLIKDRIHYKEGSELGLMLLLSDLSYQTPGGLTLSQALENPKGARHSTSTLPGSKEQNAGIMTKSALFGISHRTKLSSNLSHFALIQGGYSDLRNPFITNYEKRYERQFAARTYFTYEKRWENWAYESRLGLEAASNKSTVQNYDNLKGKVGAAQNFDELSARSGFLFTSQKMTYKERLVLEGALSWNAISLGWTSLYPEKSKGAKSPTTELLPSLSALYLFERDLSLRIKLSKGSSSPTLEEIRSSDQKIRSSLRSEFGWNKEIGLRKALGSFLFVDLSYFELDLKEAIVKRQNNQGEDYFLNEGGQKQKGFEFSLETRPISIGILRNVRFYGSGSFYDFTFESSSTDLDPLLEGKRIPGVPSTSLSSLLSLDLFQNFGIHFSNYYRSSQYLNSQNTVDESASLLGQLRLEYRFLLDHSEAEVFFSLPNLYNTKQSLGYDINAFGGRYYNPAPPTGFQLGIKASF